MRQKLPGGGWRDLGPGAAIHGVRATIGVVEVPGAPRLRNAAHMGPARKGSDERRERAEEVEALVKEQGSVAAAARALGISRQRVDQILRERVRRPD